MTLDDLDLERIDPQGMLAMVEDSPAQWRDALARSLDAPLPALDAADVRAVVVAGMGGSGIAGDVASVAAAAEGGVPVVAAKGYRLPAYTGPDTLVVAVSYSGNTEETLACVDQATAAGAPCYAVTSGGVLGERAADAGFPIALVPGGGQPRANLPNLAVPVLVTLERAGLLQGVVEQLQGIERHLSALVARWSAPAPADVNEVKATATALAELVPVFYGGEAWGAVAALRAKCQVNENAKRPAFANSYPELDHNEIVGWRALPDTCSRFGLVELRDHDREHPQVARRFALTRELIGSRLGAVRSVPLAAPTPLSWFAAAVLFVDLLSVYLAFLGDQDPTPVAAIEALKSKLAEP